jgi:hypothetical protein
MDLIKNSDTDDPSTNSNYELLNSAYVWQNGNVTNVEEDLEKGGSGYKSEGTIVTFHLLENTRILRI